VDSLRNVVGTEVTRIGEKKIDNAVVNMSDWLRRVTLDIIGTGGMGYDFNALEEPKSELNVIYDTIFNKAHNESLMLFIETMENLFPVAWLGSLPVEHNRMVYDGAQAIRKLAAMLIEEKKQSSQKDDSYVHKDILGVAVASGEFTDEGLVDQVMTFLAAGHETVSSSMSWALVSLCQYPHIQQKLRDEVRNGLPSPSKGVELNPRTINSLSYLHAVCNEVLRYHTPVPLSRRTSVKETSILGHRVPKGTNILLVPAAVHFSKDIWGHDALEFNPERWMQPNCGNSGGSTSSFGNMPFMHGTYQ
jgi:cytochrome P450